ncbi:hypothetical protein HJC23_011338 [Cyclotella cryptica]|uniref:Uncharacterized protein n=1 Tax=Cyclotella cryptica TaxID=29204 RepID=A0ABD3QVY4_9STRA
MSKQALRLHNTAQEPNAAAATDNHTHAFVSNSFDRTRDSLSTCKRTHNSVIKYDSHRTPRPRVDLYSPVVPNETVETTAFKSHEPISFQEGIVKNSVFPTPPPPPTDEELHADGLPILVQAATHAKAGRTMCVELPENGCVSVSYHTVLRDSTKIAKYIESVMRKDNDSVGDFEKPRTVAHLTEPGSEYLSSMWGTWASGFCTVPLATSHREHEFEHVLKDADPEIIIIGGHVARGEEEGAARTKTLPPHNEGELLQAANAVGMADRIVYLRDLITDDATMTTGESTSENGNVDEFHLGANGSIPSLDSPSMIMYTSGTTGLPKGVLTSHRNIYHQITDLVSAWQWKPTDVALHLLPLHHVHGAVNILSCAAYAGACCEFMHFRCDNVWKRLAEAAREEQTSGESSGESESAHAKKHMRKPNVFMAVPTIYSKMIEAAEHNVLEPGIVPDATKTLSEMRLMISGSAALPVSLNEKWKNLTGHILLERYGMTEFAMALSNPYEPMNKRLPGYVGTPLPSVEVRIVDENNNIVPPESGKSGELQVRGPHVFQGYLNRPDVTKKEFASDGSGFFKTGDIASYDKEEKSFKILGRASVDIIKNGGHKLSALEIERDLLEHPFIAECAVLGVPDETWGERVGMVCRMKNGEKALDLDQLRCWAEHRMARYKVPSRIVVVDEIPKNAMGKINKKSLKSLFEGTLAP